LNYQSFDLFNAPYNLVHLMAWKVWSIFNISIVLLYSEPFLGSKYSSEYPNLLTLETGFLGKLFIFAQ